jgi:hypothetical protein
MPSLPVLFKTTTYNLPLQTWEQERSKTTLKTKLKTQGSSSQQPIQSHGNEKIQITLEISSFKDSPTRLSTLEVVME